jgi:hypothetical protein
MNYSEITDYEDFISELDSNDYDTSDVQVIVSEALREKRKAVKHKMTATEVHQ